MRDPHKITLLSFALLGLVSASCGKPRREDSLIGALVAAIPGRRPLEARLSGGFAWQSCATETERDELIPELRCTEGPFSAEERDRIDEVAARIHEAGRHGPSAAASHASGLLDLLAGSGAASAEAAIVALQEAAALEPGAEVFSDLSAAYLTRAARRDDARDLLAAFSAAEEALTYDAECPEAAFNRSLVLERLALDTAAAAGWREYQRLDPGSAWSGEAEGRLAALERPSLQELWEDESRRLTGDSAAGGVPLEPRLRQLVRLQVEEEVLPAWADRQLNGFLADEPLATARLWTRALAASGGDALLARAVQVIDSAAEDPRRLAELAEGHRAYGTARRLHEEQRYDEAGELFLDAEGALHAAGSPFALWASFYLAVGEYHRPDYRAALESLHRLRHRCREEPFPALRGHVLWMLGLTQHVKGNPQAAESFYRQALRSFEDAGELENQAAMENLLARILDQLGYDEDAWTHRYRALRGLEETTSCRRQNNLLTNWVDTTLSAGQPALSALFRDELVRRSRACGNPLLLAIALRRSAKLEDLAGHDEDALAALDEGWRLSEQIPSDGTRMTVQTDLLRARASVERQRDPEEAMRFLEEARQRFERRGYHLRRIDVQRELAQAYVTAGRIPEAREALADAVAEARRQAVTVEPRHWSRFLHVVLPLYRDLLAFEVDTRNDPRAAFTLNEEARFFAMQSMSGYLAAHSDADAGTAPTGRLPKKAPTLREVQAQLAADERLIAFESLPDELLVWVVSSSDVGFERRSLTAAELAERVASFVDRAREGDPDPGSGSPLWELLMGGLRDRIPERARLVILPGGPLHRLPFAALRASESGPLLLEGHQIVVAPSAAVFLRCRERERELGQAPATGTILALGDPAFDRDLAPHLGDLPHAAAEARSVAGLYRRSVLLLGAQATPELFLDHLRQDGADVVHIAAHALLNPERPELSTLLLAPAEPGRDSGSLELSELFTLDLPRTRLVVLSACDSARSADASTGFASLAIPFLAAGVPQVVASVWPVDDRASAALLHEFHRRLLDGRDGAAALREAQRSLSHGTDATLRLPRSWAAFVVLGSPSQP